MALRNKGSHTSNLEVPLSSWACSHNLWAVYSEVAAVPVKIFVSLRMEALPCILVDSCTNYRREGGESEAGMLLKQPVAFQGLVEEH